MKKERVFVMDEAPCCFGDLCILEACFRSKVHVRYSVVMRNGSKLLLSVGEPTKCDGSCRKRKGEYQNFGGRPKDCAYATCLVVEKVRQFLARRQKKMNKKK